MIFIRILVKGYLKNINENLITEFEYRGIRNKNRISYVDDDGVKFSIKIIDNDILVVRDGKDFVNSFIFSKNKNKSSSNYLIKKENFDVDIEIDTIDIVISDNSIFVKYLVLDTDCLYEYKIEVGDIV